MNLLSQAGSLNPGSDLWVVPERKNCQATQKIDWYLNFQISKASKHQARPLSQKVTDILEKCELPQHSFEENEDNSLLIASHLALPNRWVLVIKGSDQFEDWVASIAQKHKHLNSPSTRIFLPNGKTLEEFQKTWSKSSQEKDLSVVIDA